MVIDTSVLLAIVFDEEYCEWSEIILKKYLSQLKMSTVNLAEFLTLIKSRRPGAYQEIKENILNQPIQFINLTINQADIAARTRQQYKNLNFGDCFVYALAKEQDDSIITLDQDFLKTDLQVIYPNK